MAKVGSLVRCLTSRHVCFPLIFTIAAISLIITTLQFSNIRDSSSLARRGWKERKTTSMRYKQENQKLLRKWNPDVIADAPFQKISTLTDTKPEKINTFQKIKVPSVDVKKKLKQSKLPIKKVRTQANMPSMQAQRVTTTKGSHKDDAQNLRHNAEKHTNESKVIVRNLSDFNDSLNEILNVAENGIPEITDVIHDESKLELLPEQTKGVIIVTNYRSGSTFLGELFNQHPDAFYTFEPLYPFGSNCSFENNRRVQVLHDILKCTFPSMKNLYKDLNKNAETEGQVHSGCVRNNFCFRYNHKDLCSKDICPNGNPDTCMHCGPADLPHVNNKCRTRKMTVIKVIKLCYIKSLEQIILDPSFDLKIIHLVRDPRGIASSRLKIHPNWDVAENIMATCQRQAANVRAGRKIDWLKDKYKLVRYEDIAMNPVETAKDIYKFVGLPFIDNMKTWILRNTRSRSKNRDDANIRAKRLGVNGKYDSAKDPYSTQRDSSTAMQAWRNHLSFDAIGQIQKRCFETLRSLGYKDFKTPQNLTNLDLAAVL